MEQLQIPLGCQRARAVLIYDMRVVVKIRSLEDGEHAYSIEFRMISRI